MEFKIKRKDFLDGLSQAQGVVEKKNTMPILANVLLEADDQGIKISATDLEVAISSQVTAQVIKPGKITILSKSLLDIVREAGSEDIKLSVGDSEKIELKAGSASFKIPGLNAAEFPSFPAVIADSVEVPCDLLKGMIDKTSFSMANDETRFNLNGVLLQKDANDELRMVATDGHRLSLVWRDNALSGVAPFSVIIPRKGVNELKRLVSHEGSLELAIGTKGLLARKGNETLYVRFLDGEFPQYKAVIPTDNNVIATINRASLVGALRRVSLLSNERSRGVILSFSPGHIELSTTNPDLGEAREEMEIDYKGQKMGIGFNARYVLDVLDVLKDEKVQFVLKGEINACILRSEEDKGFLCVIMPMRI